MDDAPTICGFLSNVQGDYDFFEKYVEISRILAWADESKASLDLADSAYFVFGGNVQGTGQGDLRIARLLLDLKKKYPDRVKLLMGNMDIQLLKFAYLSDDSSCDDAEFKRSIPEGVDSLQSKVRWLLQDLVGSDEPFEQRRKELSLLSNSEDSQSVSDEVVAASFTAQVLETGEDNLMLRYLNEAQLAWIFGATLFVHGGITAQGAGTVPGREGTISRSAFPSPRALRRQRFARNRTRCCKTAAAPVVVAAAGGREGIMLC